ncbi:MAG: right-handed parallel beta-helix repeat-containing protein [Thermogutta sp.]
MMNTSHSRMLFVAELWLAAMLVFTSLGARQAGAEIPKNEVAIREVEAGQRDTANAAWWSFDPEDSTQALQAALRSRAKKIIIPNMSQPWVVEKIELLGNKEIVFEPGVEIVAKRGAFRGRADCLFTATNQENLIITGNGAILRMWREDYANPPYEKAEWRHCLSLRGCRNVVIKDLTLRDSGGDGIYLGTGKGGEPNQDIVIRNVICDSNYRQGISVITARNLLIENVVLRNTGGTPPQAGIDFEPNRASEILSNCVMRNCIIENNRGNAIHLYAGAMNASSEPISIRLENCHTRGTNAASLSIATKNQTGEYVTGVFEVVNCRFEDSGTAGVIIRSKPAAGLRVHLKNCEIIESSSTPRWPAPIVLVSRPGDENDLGHIVLDNLIIRDAVPRPILHFDNGSGVCLKDITGTITARVGADEKQVTLDERTITQWFPCDPIRQLSIVAADRLTLGKPIPGNIQPGEIPRHRLRQIANYIFHAQAGDRVAMEMAYERVGQNTGTRLPVHVIGPGGNLVHKTEIAFQGQSRLEITAPETGIYRLYAEPGPNTVRLVSSSHPLSIIGQKGTIHFIGTTGRFYCYVPAGKQLGLGVSGDPPGECVAATIFDHANSGQPIWETTGCETRGSFVSDAAEESRVFCLELTRPAKGVLEDEYIVIRGVPAILSFSPDVLFAIPQDDRP